MSALVEFSMFPTEKTQSKSAFVARVLDIIDASGYPYRLTPMGTIFETPTTKEAFDLINRAYEELQSDCGRVYCNVKVDWRDTPMGRLEKKTHSVEEKLGRTLHT